MRRFRFVLCILLVGCGMSAAAHRVSPNSTSINAAGIFPPSMVFAVDTNNQLRHFDAASPGTILGTVPINGLRPGESILGIDFRPATGQLYGLGSSSQL